MIYSNKHPYYTLPIEISYQDVIVIQLFSPHDKGAFQRLFHINYWEVTSIPVFHTSK